MITVHFDSVGRGKKSWSKQYPKMPSLDVVANEASKALMSREVDAELDSDNMTGTIYAGFHRVGTFRVEIPGEERD